MADKAIKISEVSEMLRMQLKGIDNRAKFEETGVVVSVSDGVIRSSAYTMPRQANCLSSTTV